MRDTIASLRRDGHILAVIAGLYLGISTASVFLASYPGAIAAIGLSNAVAIAGLTRIQRPLRLPLFALLSLAGIISSLVGGMLVGSSVSMFISSALEIGIGASILRWANADGNYFGDVTHAIKLFAFILFAPLIGSTLGALLMDGYNHRSLQFIWARWYVADVLGLLALLPAALLCTERRLRRFLLAPRGVDFLYCAGMALSVSCLALLKLPQPFVYIAVPLILAAIRLDLFSLTVLTALNTVFITTLISLGFYNHELVPQTDIVLLYLPLAMTIVPALALTVAMAALRREKQTLAESEERFRGAMESAAIGMALVAKEGGWLQVNDALCRMLGYQRDQFMLMTFQQVTHPDDLNADLQRVAAVIDGSIDSYQIEKRYYRSDGTLLWGALSVSAVRDGAGRLKYFVSQIADISVRKRAEEVLRASEQRMRAALAGGSVMAWEYNVVTGELMLSDAWKRKLGYEPHELPTLPGVWRSRIHPGDIDTNNALLDAHLQGLTPFFESDQRLRCKDGHYIWMRVSGMVLERDTDNKALRMAGTQKEITALKEAELARVKLAERASLAIQAGGVGIWELDIHSGELLWDDRMFELYGLQPGGMPMTYQRWEKGIHPEDYARAMQTLRRAVDGELTYNIEFRVVWPNGEIRNIRAQATTLRNDAGEALRMVGTNWDVSELRRLADALYAEKERLRVTLYSIADAVVTTDDEARITFMNPQAETMTGWSLHEAAGHSIEDIFQLVDDTGHALPNPSRACLARGSVYQSQQDAVLIARSGDRYDIQDSAAPVKTQAGEVIGAILVLQNVTKNRAMQRQLNFNASHDALTGLFNRVKFERELAYALERVREEHSEHVLCFIDLDRFKIVNDSAGHAAGDVLLRELGSLMQSHIRGHDILARLGGDEFGLLLLNCQLDQAQSVLTALLEQIRALRFPWEGQIYDVGASIGVVSITARSPSASALMSQVDVACYAAKHAGRNRVSVYQQERSEAQQHHQEIFLAAGLRDALDKNRFVLHGQDVVSTRAPNGDQGENGRYYEILLRMFDPDGALVPPGAFIPAAERFDLMADIDRWVINETLKMLSLRPADAPRVAVAINLSANSLSDSRLLPYLTALLDDLAVDPSLLMFEITETALINQVSTASRLLSTLRERGCKVALDDFGSGLSSFNYLKSFKVDVIKIDGSFVRNIVNNPVDRAIVESIYQMATRLQATTVAECVESLDALELLRGIGIDYVQGYAIARPRAFANILREEAVGKRVVPLRQLPKK